MSGTVKSQGLELVSKWKTNDLLNFALNYTYTSTYDGAEQDDPNKNSNYYNAQMVRVPRNIINLTTNYKILGDKNLDLTLNTKWSDVARDYGNGNRTYADERLDDYLVNDLFIKYKLWNKYNIFFNITNVLDEKYETARDYSQMDRSFNFGIKNSFLKKCVNRLMKGSKNKLFTSKMLEILESDINLIKNYDRILYDNIYKHCYIMKKIIFK